MKNYIDLTQSFQSTPEQELRIYARFLEKRQRSLFLSKIKYYTKLAVYSLGLVMIVGTALFSFPQQSQQLYTRILSNKAVEVYTPNPATVYADTIGTIVSLQWDATLTRDGKEYPLEQIFSDTTVVLKAWTILTFQIAWGLQTQLIGPAKFQLHREWANANQIVLDIQEGHMIQVESVSPWSWMNEQTTEMTIKTPQLQLASIRSDKKVKLQIDTTHKNPMIANQGDVITIKTTDTEKWVIVASIQSQQLVVINDAGKLEQEIIGLTKKIIIGDQEISFNDLFEESLSPENISGTEMSGTLLGMPVIAVTSGTEVIDSWSVDPIWVALATVTHHEIPKKWDGVVKKEEIIEPSSTTGIAWDVLGTKDLLKEKDFSALKSQLYAPHFQQALRGMLLSYARADYQTFLGHKKEISKAMYSIYESVDFSPHIRVIASDPQVAVRQYQSLIDQLLLSIDRSRGIPTQYINKMMSIEVSFIIMRNIGYGKFIESKLTDDELWKLIGDEVKKVAK